MDFAPNRSTGLNRLYGFVSHAGRKYAASRNHDNGVKRDNVSQLSPWLHAGLLGEREVLAAVLTKHSPDQAEKFIAEVFWRLYFKGYLEQRPSIWAAYGRQRDEAFAALTGNAGLTKAYAEAIEGRTGIAAFDHWARELVATGYLHNHARMWFASIWIFTLKLDWALGADFFLRHLMDGDAASNTLSWRWVGGLHTVGKTYLARAENIARYTEHHPDGPLTAEGLARHVEPLTEGEQHGRQRLGLPPAPYPSAFAQPFALLLHDEGASHCLLDLPHPPALVIGAARPHARSPQPVGTYASDFAHGAVRSGMEAAGAAFACPTAEWTQETSLASLLENAGLTRIVTPYLPTGWTRDALWPGLERHAPIQLLPETSRQTFPHARAGFFAVKKEIPQILHATRLA
ncbi:FAD-binding domain-containing protein [Erythrobacter sp. EC-HK427]|uniref:FAD-binding domain-containing protein n=1 Tax=Erythrobacter sp. EC-HK427 TaxID=2038396 RepID=UPI001258B0D8|nr:FAD-binding domain-containing protein [Erythrobacter sp. EC-HK427]VVT09803.1 DNA photolyase [Erythrobacter sp. EC-HK427]